MLVFKMEDHDGEVSANIDIVNEESLDWKVSIVRASIGDGYTILIQDDDDIMTQWLSITDLQELGRGIHRLLAATVGEQLCLMPIQQSTTTQG